MKKMIAYLFFAQLLFCQHPTYPVTTNSWLTAQGRNARTSTGGVERDARQKQRAYWRVTLSNGVEFDSADVRSVSGDSVLLVERETPFWIELRSIDEIRILKPSNAFLCIQAGGTTGFIAGLIAVAERYYHPLETPGFFFAGPAIALLPSLVGGLFGGAVGVLGDGDLVCHLEGGSLPEKRSALLDAMHAAEDPAKLRDIHVSLLWGYSLSRFDKGGIRDESVPKTFAAARTLCLNGEISLRVYGPLALWIGAENDMTPILEELSSYDTEFELQKGIGKYLIYVPPTQIYAGTHTDVVRAGARLPFVDNNEMRIALGIGGGMFNYQSGFYRDDAMQSPISETEGTAYGLCADVTLEAKLTNGPSFISRIEISTAPKTLAFQNLLVQGYEWTNRIDFGGLRFLVGVTF